MPPVGKPRICLSQLGKKEGGPCLKAALETPPQRVQPCASGAFGVGLRCRCPFLLTPVKNTGRSNQVRNTS